MSIAVLNTAKAKSPATREPSGAAKGATSNGVPASTSTAISGPSATDAVTLPLVTPPVAAPAAHGAPLPAPPEVDLEYLKEQSLRLENASPREIIAWAVENYFPSLTMATAFGPEGCVIIHFLAEIEPRTHLFNLDTGYQFKETLELRDRLAKRYGVEVELKQAATTVAEYEAQNGGPLYKTNPDQCCFDRKITVLRQAAVGYRAWMSGIRRDQSSDRAKAAIVGWDKKFGLVKISPLANWTKQDVWKLITEQNIPYNPLHDQGYTSIGCWPCTRAVMFGEDERAGRWSGTGKKECGLHTSE